MLDFKIRLLGPIEVLRDGCIVALSRAKPRALLAALALRANQNVALETLIDALWADHPPPSAVANLRSYASSLRQAVSDRLLTRPRGYLLRINDHELDIHEFTRLVTEGRTSLSVGDTATARARLSEALGLWRGPAGEDLGVGATLETQLAAFERERQDVFEDYVDAALGHAIPTQLTTQLREHLAREPLRERAWAQLMLLHYRSGDIESALSAYRDARQALRGHLGVEPGQALVDLRRAIQRRDPRLNRPSRSTIRHTSPLDHRAPIPKSLREFAIEANLTDEEIRMLSAIRPNGRTPSTVERWRHIYNAIQTSEAIDIGKWCRHGRRVDGAL